MKNMKVFLGISINNPYFSRKNLTRYLDYVSGLDNNIEEFAFLIGDSPYALTRSVLNKTSISESSRIVKEKGQEFVTLIKKILTENEKKFDFDIKILVWDDLTDNVFYKQLYYNLLNLYNNDICFRKSVEKQVWVNLHNKLSSIELNDYERFLLDYYVLDEIAGLITMSDYYGFKLELYPDNDLFIIEEIVNSRYDFLRNSKREFRQLRFI